jgi:pyruvate,water dikinase
MAGIPGVPGAVLSGCAASPGVAEGIARVVLDVDGIAAVQSGEILVAPATTPTWLAVFGRIAAVVTDTGGVTSHAAIVCREYRLPAVTSTATGSTVIRTGIRLRVDGNTGHVTVLAS